MLVAAKLDRLSQSVVHLGSLLEQADREGWALSLLDFDVDTSKPTGRLVAHVLAAVAEFERQRIRERTREALAQLKASGTRLGRPRQTPDDVVERIVSRRAKGWTLRAIADALNRNGVETVQGGRQWWPATVQSVLRSAELDRGSRGGPVSRVTRRNCHTIVRRRRRYLSLDRSTRERTRPCNGTRVRHSQATALPAPCRNGLESH
jgi:hypothetical protein